ncbi:MAG: ABC transporter substrate-binding protein [Saccharofermentanales bacterium]|jgi:peptide/nickel transport system substrate-binding protein
MKKILAILLVAVLLVGVLSACGESSTPSKNQPGSSLQTDETIEQTTQQVKKEVTMGYLGVYNTFCASTGLSDLTDAIGPRMVFDYLFETDDYTLETYSRTLESHEWLDDATLKMTLKKGILFSDGTEMTGNDILVTLRKYVENKFTEIKYYEIIDFDNSYVKDTYTVYLKYKEVNKAADARLIIPIVSAAFWETHPDGDDAWWNGQVNGSGPYKVVDSVLDQHIVFEKRSDYWDDSVRYDADKITVNFYTDGTALLADLQNGVVDMALNLNNEMMSNLDVTSDSNIVLGTVSSYEIVKYCFNNVDGPTADINVRKALTLSIDWTELAEVVYGLCGVIATSHYPTSFSCYEEHPAYSYDVEAAKQCLADAGYKAGDLTLYFLATDNEQRMIGEMAQYYYEQIGVTLKVDQVEPFAAFSFMMDGTTHQIMLKQQPGGNPAREPFDDFFLPESVFRTAAITDTVYGDLMITANMTTDDAERIAMYKQVDDYLYDNYQLIPIAELLVGFAYNNDIVSDFSVCSFGVRGSLASVRLP